jgi:hypothetical protein
MRTFFAYLYYLCFVGILNALIPSDPTLQLVKSISNWHQVNPIEKAYITTDKPLYAPGETIWYSAWVLHGQDHTLTSPSGVLTVELLSDANEIIQSHRIRIENGRGHGDFYLTDATTQGVYSIRSYTNWMQNAGDAYFYYRDIFVTGPSELGVREPTVEVAGSNIHVDLHSAGGVSLEIEKTDDEQIEFRIQTHQQIEKPLSIVAHVRGLIGFVARSNETLSEFSGSIPKSRFENGIIHFTVFDANGTPVAQKLVFNDLGNTANLSINPDRDFYATRDLVTLDIALTDQAGNPIEGSFSASIVHEASIPDTLWRGTGIRDWLLLKSDLKYGSDHRIKNVDSVLAMKSWSRFTWETLGDAFQPPKFQLEPDLLIRGRVVDDITKRAAREQDVTIFVMGNTQEVIQVYTDQDGYFQSPLFVQDTSNVMLQTRNSKGKKHYDIRLDPHEPTPASITRTLQTPARVDFFNYLTNARQRVRDERAYGLDPNFKLLGEITVEAQREQDMAGWWFKPTTGANFRMDAADAKHNARTAIDMLRGAHGKFVLLHDQVLVFSRGARVPARIYIDGVESDLLEASTLPIEWIDHMELIWEGALMLTTSFMGQDLRPLVAFYTKRDRDLVARQPGMVNIKYPGYTTASNFYAIDYSVPEQAHEMPDRRVTLHWEPIVHINRSGMARVTFYTGDLEGSIRIMIEGVTSDGEPIIMGTSLKVVK